MRGRLFLETARRLLSGQLDGGQEEDLRTVAGRCYYAVFLEFVEWFENQGSSLTGGARDHAILLCCLDRLSRDVKWLRRVVPSVRKLREFRVQADYRLIEQEGFRFNESSMALCVERAEGVLKKLDEYSGPAGLPPDQLAQAVQQCAEELRANG